MGYIGDHDLLLHILEAIKKLKKPNLVFVCDPVMVGTAMDGIYSP